MRAKVFYMAALMAVTALLTASCGSTSKFVKQTGNDKGELLASADLDLPEMIAATKYACDKTGLVIKSETADGGGAVPMIAILKASLSDWGQIVKITAVKGEIYYIAKPRIEINVTANIPAIRNNFKTHLTTYIEAAQEGIDLNTINIGK